LVQKQLIREMMGSLPLTNPEGPVGLLENVGRPIKMRGQGGESKISDLVGGRITMPRIAMNLSPRYQKRMSLKKVNVRQRGYPKQKQNGGGGKSLPKWQSAKTRLMWARGHRLLDT